LKCFNLFTFKRVHEWRDHAVIHQPPIPVVEEGKPIPPVHPKSLYKIVSEHKDVVKVVIMLSSIVSTFKADCKDVLSEMDAFKELWNEVRVYNTCSNGDDQRIKLLLKKTRLRINR